MQAHLDHLVGPLWPSTLNRFAELGAQYIDEYNRDESGKPLRWLLAAVWLRQAAVHAKVAALTGNTLPHAGLSQARILLEISASLRYALGDATPTAADYQEVVAQCYVVATLLRDKKEMLDGLRGRPPGPTEMADLSLIDRQLNNPEWDGAVVRFVRKDGPHRGEILHKDWRKAMGVKSFDDLLVDDTERLVYSQSCGGIHSSDVVANVFGAGPRKILPVNEAPPLPLLMRASMLSSMELCCRVVFRTFPMASHPFLQHCQVLTFDSIRKAEVRPPGDPA